MTLLPQINNMGLPSNRFKRVVYSITTSLVTNISSILLRIYQATLNIEVHGMENLIWLKARKKNYIIALWHTFVDAAVFTLHTRNILIYSDHPRTHKYEKSSAHFFREIGLKALKSYEFDILDASLGKQSSGLIQFIHKIKQGSPAMIAPDGPHGPIYKAKPGTAYIASKTGASIVPIGFGFSRKITGPNWDDFALPLPFSRVVVSIGKPIDVPEGGDPELQKEITELLETSLDYHSFLANKLL